MELPQCRLKPPFRADHIGSLLRPDPLKEALAKHAAGGIGDGELKAVQDHHIREAIRLQEAIGLQGITDGEYRRSLYFDHFPKAVSGFEQREAEMDFRDGSGAKLKYMTPIVVGRLRRNHGIATEEFQFVKTVTRATPKITLPSPGSQHFFRWREGVSEKAYPDLEEFHADVAQIYRAELQDLAALGATYVQLDDVALPLLCDQRLREGVRKRGYDPDRLVDQYIAVTNESLKGCPQQLTIGMHLCRGNNQGRWLGEGGYEAVAEKIFAGLNLDFFCLEYDSPRAGSFEALRYMPQNKTVVLGLVSSKTAVLEPRDALRSRIEEASRFVAIERLCLSPQCGFASAAAGNPLTPDDQKRKLELVVSVADAVWGAA